MTQPTQLHELTFTREEREGIAITDSFPEGGKVGIDSPQMMCAPNIKPHATDHLIKDQNRSLAFGQISQFVQKVVLWLIILDRLQYQGGNLPGVLVKESLNPLDIIVRKS